MRTACGMILAGISVAFMPLLAANVSYTPQGSAPYYWSNAAAWGGTEPTRDDDATINNATLKASPLTIQGGTSAVGGFVHVDNGTLYVEPNATLTTRDTVGSDGGIYLAKSASSTGVVTNYGTITTCKLDLGEYNAAKGTLARFDNFGTLTIEKMFRFQMDGTPSVFHNHAGATVRKTGGDGWSFYFGYKAGSYSTLVNEGDFFDNTHEIWMGLTARSSSQNDIIVNGNGRFFAEKNVAIGVYANSLATITLNDNGYLSGNAVWRLGGRGTTAGTSNNREEGRIVLNDNSAFAASNYVYVGFADTAKGSITLNDSSRMTIDNGGQLYIARGSSSTGLVSVCDSASLVFPKSYVYVGAGASSVGRYEVGGTSCVTNPTIIVASGANSTGTLALSGNCRFVEPETFYVGYNTGAKGYYTLTDSAKAEHGHYFWVAGKAGAVGEVSLRGNSYVSVTNNTMYVGKASSATGIVTVADNAVLNATNIIIAYEAASVGTLGVAGSGVVSNITRLVIGPGEKSTMRALLKMSGGSVLFNGEIVYESNGINVASPLAIDSRTVNTGSIRGWGKVAFEDPITALRDAASPRGFVHYGQIFADGGGVMRDLDFGRFGVMGYNTTSANPNGTNGWFAVNKGRLKLPRSVPSRSGHKCVGDFWTTDVDLPAKNSRLANIFNYEFTGAETNHFVFSELYATDREDIPAGLGDIGADKIIAVWRIGYFSDGPEIDEPTHPSPFTSAKLKFKYSPEGLDGLRNVYVYRHDGTADGKWVRAGARTAPSTTMPVVSTRGFESSSENWNLGWFAIVGREQPFGSVMVLR